MKKQKAKILRAWVAIPRRGSVFAGAGGQQLTVGKTKWAADLAGGFGDKVVRCELRIYPASAKSHVPHRRTG